MRFHPAFRALLPIALVLLSGCRSHELRFDSDAQGARLSSKDPFKKNAAIFAVYCMGCDAWPTAAPSTPASPSSSVVALATPSRQNAVPEMVFLPTATQPRGLRTHRPVNARPREEDPSLLSSVETSNGHRLIFTLLLLLMAVHRSSTKSSGARKETTRSENEHRLILSLFLLFVLGYRWLNKSAEATNETTESEMEEFGVEMEIKLTPTEDSDDSVDSSTDMPKCDGAGMGDNNTTASLKALDPPSRQCRKSKASSHRPYQRSSHRSSWRRGRGSARRNGSHRKSKLGRSRDITPIECVAIDEFMAKSQRRKSTKKDWERLVRVVKEENDRLREQGGTLGTCVEE